MKKAGWIARWLFLGAAAVGGSAFATPITFTFTGSGSGSLNGVAFATSAFTITENDDTSLRQSCTGTCEFIDDTVATINIAGLGNFTFITGTRIFSNGGVGFSRAGVTGNDLYDQNTAAIGYDLLSSIGPVSFTGSLLQWTLTPVVTTGGVLVFDSGPSAGTFQARVGTTAVPEPESLLLLAVGVLGLAVARRRRA